MGALRRLAAKVTWALFKRETVGFDVHGNKYYRMLDKNLEGEVIERRMVKFKSGSYYNPADTPPEWMQWKHKTRDESPSEDEILEGEGVRASHRERAALADAAAAEAARWHQSGGGGGGGGSFTQQLPGNSQWRRDDT